MNRDELIEKMREAAFNDQSELGRENCRKAGNKNLGLVRERMARVLDAVEGEIRRDERLQCFKRRLRFMDDSEATDLWKKIQAACDDIDERPDLQLVPAESGE